VIIESLVGNNLENGLQTDVSERVVSRLVQGAESRTKHEYLVTRVGQSDNRVGINVRGASEGLASQ